MTLATLALLGTLALGSNDDLHKWTVTDTALQLTFVTLTAVDWMQTREAMRFHPTIQFEEQNPFLGKHPSNDRIDAMIGASIAGHTLIAYLLPKPWRTIWQLTFIAVEGAAVYGNHSAGIRVKW